MISVLRVVLILGILGVLACSNELDEYKEQTASIFKEQNDEAAAFMDSLYALGDALSVGAREKSVSHIKDVLTEIQRSLDQYMRTTDEHLDRWMLLNPPKDAQLFHELSFEMMQLRIEGAVLLKTEIDAMLWDLPVDEGAIDDAWERFNRSDRLFLRVLAEARELDN